MAKKSTTTIPAVIAERVAGLDGLNPEHHAAVAAYLAQVATDTMSGAIDAMVARADDAVYHGGSYADRADALLSVAFGDSAIAAASKKTRNGYLTGVTSRRWDDYYGISGIVYGDLGEFSWPVVPVKGQAPESLPKGVRIRDDSDAEVDVELF